MFLNRFFAYLDRIFFLKISIWNFSYHSFFKEYAHIFLFKVMLTHPLRTIRGLRGYQHLIKQQEVIPPKYENYLSIPDKNSFLTIINKHRVKPLVGLGFCLKPKNSLKGSCPSGRANHDCLYLERGKTEQVCSSCAIHEIAAKCLERGYRVYIMTSAQDIARDFLLPQVKSKKFPSAILLLCPYSIQAIVLPLLICEVDMFLMAYKSGYCRDYQQWRAADKGEKEERTEISKESWERLLDFLRKSTDAGPRFQYFRREGNIFYPE